MDKSVKIKTMGLLYLVIVLFASAAAILICKLFRINIFIAEGIILVLAVPVTFIAFKILLSR